MFDAEPLGQAWLQVGELGLAFLLSTLIGLERELRQKSAGLRTYTLVGFASALIVLVSKYGFSNILEINKVVLDPSRIAAQIVSGIGFIGGGVIFVRKDIVRGLTTAATVWLVAAVGMACGAGLPLLALVVFAGHMIVVGLFPILERSLPRSRFAPSRLQVSYQDGKGILRQVLVACNDAGFSVARTQIEQGGQGQDEDIRIVTVILEIRGLKSVSKLAAHLSELDGVTSVTTHDGNYSPE